MTTLMRIISCSACVIAAGLAQAQEPRQCPLLSHETAFVERGPLAVDRLKGQVVFPVPTLPGMLGSLGGFCMAVFDVQSAEPIATGSTDAAGTFALAGLPSGDYVLIGQHASGEGGSLHLRVRLSHKPETAEPLRGLLIHVDMQGLRQSARGEVIGNLGLRRTLIGMLSADQAVRREMINQGMEDVAPGMQDRVDDVDARTKLGLAAMFRAGNVTGPNYAMLVDRVRLSEGGP